MNNIQTVNRKAENVEKVSSNDLFQRHINSFLQNDLETLVSDYTNDSVLIAQDTSYTGVEEIRGFFANLIPHFPKQKSSFELDKTIIQGDLVFIVWHGKSPSIDVPFATDTFIIKDGKIRQQTFAGQLKMVG